MPLSGVPRQRNVPESGAAKPQITLNNVVLPAPLGPITPSTSPVRTSSDTPSRAVIPPNETVTSATARSGSLGSSPGSPPTGMRIGLTRSPLARNHPCEPFGHQQHGRRWGGDHRQPAGPLHKRAG